MKNWQPVANFAPSESSTLCTLIVDPAQVQPVSGAAGQSTIPTRVITLKLTRFPFPDQELCLVTSQNPAWEAIAPVGVPNAIGARNYISSNGQQRLNFLFTRVEGTLDPDFHTTKNPDLLPTNYRADYDAFLSIYPRLVGESNQEEESPPPQAPTELLQRYFYRVVETEQDSDGDGLTDAEEARYNCSRWDSDSDGDGLNDLYEVLLKRKPSDSEPTPPSAGPGGDADGDGVTNETELTNGTDPHDADSDDDGSSDQNDPNPQDENDFPVSMVFYHTMFSETFNTQLNKGSLYKTGNNFNVPMMFQLAEPLEVEVPFETLDKDILEYHRNVAVPGPKKPYMAFSATTKNDEPVNTKEITLLRSRIWAVRGTATEQSEELDLFVAKFKETADGCPAPQLSKEKLVIPANQTKSAPFWLEDYQTTDTKGNWYSKAEPFMKIPPVIPVNSDFDEGGVDLATHFAIPDCDDASNSLKAVRDHLDKKKYKADDVMLDDLREGFFGLNPATADPEYFRDATVYITQNVGVDPYTNLPETGRIRFYKVTENLDDPTAKLAVEPLETYDMETGEQKMDLVANNTYKKPTTPCPNRKESGPKLDREACNTSHCVSQIKPDPVKDPTKGNRITYYIEGVRPGKCTLKWELTAASKSIAYEQTFLVATQKTKQQWKDEVYYQIRLQTKVTLPKYKYIPTNELNLARFLPNKPWAIIGKYVNQVYYYYQQLYQEDHNLLWPGMAKTAGAGVYMSMAEADFSLDWLGHPGAAAGWRNLLHDFLLKGNWDIFDDMAWAHRCYRASGIEGLDYMEKVEEGLPNQSTVYEAWKLLDLGIKKNLPANVAAANKQILQREQLEVMQPLYNPLAEIDLFLTPAVGWAGIPLPPLNLLGMGNAGEFLSLNANINPIPGGPGFRAVVGPTARLDKFDDRWAWINRPQNGMFQLWENAGVGRRATWNNQNLKAAALPYKRAPAFIPDNLPQEPWN